ncbi:hypothetical protein [Bordetella flabilis]|uniref:Uncharacterized protein n=1 Tax=Bordetella flabilis TaxID=463014 RepID=A0A193G9T7_9BORD|nr:hypothetical protein [Bordetella flabilis]ANN76747.1 hypothetical protein BAU07_06155 [Bordetella flabilis]
MPEVGQLQTAIRRWHEAHCAVMDFFERNDILDPEQYKSWMKLRDAEDDARMNAEELIDVVRADDS